MPKTRRVDNPTFQADILALYDKGLSIQAISRELSFAYPLIYHWLRDNGYKTAISRKAPCRKPEFIRNGYRHVFRPEHPNADEEGYVREHVLVASKAMGRALGPGEQVHHINGVKLDNRNCNLLVCDRHYHMWLHRHMAVLYQQEHFPPLGDLYV